MKKIDLTRLPSCAGFVALTLVILFALTGIMNDAAFGYGKTTPVKNFRLSQIGVRAVGMGGAYCALSDDVEAIVWNPAGLSFLNEPEIICEFKYFQISLDHPQGGSFSSPQSGDFKTSYFSPSFIAGFYAFSNFTLGIGAGRSIDYQEEWKSDYITLSQLTIPPMRSETHIWTNEFYVSGAFLIGRGFAIGATGRAIQFNIDYSGAQEGYLTLPWEASDNDQTFGGSLGLLYLIGSKIRLGFTFDSGFNAEFKELFFGEHRESFTVPWTAKLGAAFFLMDRLSITTDFGYSPYTDRLQDIEMPWYPEGKDNFQIDDVMQASLGGEYIFLINKDNTIAARAGASYSGSPDFWYKSLGSDDPATRAVDESLSVLFQEPEAFVHFTAGVGYQWHSLRTDIAVDFYEGDIEYHASAAWRF